MGNLTRTARVRFDGDVRGLSAATKRAEKDLERLQSQAKSFATGFAAVGAASGLGAAAIGAALPVLGSLALQFGVVKLAMKANNAESKAYKKQLEAMKKPLQDLSNTAGKAFLPGVTKFLKDGLTLFPTLNGAVERTGKIMGDTASKLGDLFKTDKFKKDLDGFFRATEPVTRAIGDSFVTLIGKLVEFGSKMRPAAEGFASLLGGATRGVTGLLDALAPHADSFKRIFQSLGKIVEDVLPIIGQFAGAMADRLAPILESVAGFIDRNKDALSGWVPMLADAAVALGGLRIAQSVAGWLGGIVKPLADIALKAGGAAGGLDGVAGSLGKFKGAGGAAGVALAIGAVAFAIDDLNVKAAGSAEKLDGIAVNLHQFRETVGKIFSGDIGFTRMVDQAKAAAMGIMNQFKGVHLTPITLEFNGTPAQAELDRLINEVNSSVPEVNINGNTTGAGFALREIMAEIAAGKPEIMINGNPIPAEEARQYVVSLINASNGTLNIDGDNKAAGDSLAQILGRVNAARPSITIDGNNNPATGKTTQAVRFADGSKGTITVDGNPIPANGKTTGAVKFANGSKGTVTIDGNQTPANGKINATVTYANGRTGTIQVSANTGGAQGQIDQFIRNNSGKVIPIRTVIVGGQIARGGIASAGRLAAGGPVKGPGSGTSDTAGLFALSNGEHVLTARDVKAMGGHGAVMSMRRALSNGEARSFASPAGAAAGGQVGPAPVGAPVVQVFIDGQEFRGMVRTEISESNRQTRRLVGSGAFRGV